jgi:hypothetical protein
MREKMEDSWMFLVGALGIPILGIILLLVPWRKLRRGMHYPLSPDGIDKEAKVHASHTIYMGYMEQGPSRRKDTSSS